MGYTKNDDEAEKKRNLQILAVTMSEYTQKFHQNEDEIKKNLYKRYNISSRSELKNSDIIAEIESFRTAIISGIA